MFKIQAPALFKFDKQSADHASPKWAGPADQHGLFGRRCAICYYVRKLRATKVGVFGSHGSMFVVFVQLLRKFKYMQHYPLTACASRCQPGAEAGTGSGAFLVLS